jgi:hypothetical protein
VSVGSNGSTLTATAQLRSDVPEGSVFVESGLAEGGLPAAEGELVEVTP